MLRVFVAGHFGVYADSPRLQPIGLFPPLTHMNSWYYSQADQAIGPFQMDVLSKLVQAGVINDATPVRQADDAEWQPLATVLATATPPPPPPPQNETPYYYLDAADQPVGPFDVAALQRLHAEKVIRADTLVSGIGEPEWISAARLLKLPGALAPVAALPAHREAQPVLVSPRQLPFERYVLLTALTLGLYPFYLVPCQSRDLKAITGRQRMEFTALLILGIVTLSLLLLVMQVLYAFDLERHGKAVNKASRQESLGTLVLVLTVLGVVLSFAIDNWFVSYLVGTFFGSGALWLVQKEINLYATTPEPITTA